MLKKLLTMPIFCMVLLFILAGCGNEPESAAVADPQPAVVETVPADGSPDDVTCKGTYTSAEDTLAAAADTVVATVSSVDHYAELTNGQLQIYYWLEAAAYRQAGHEISPDFSKPLDTQVCEIDSRVGSWQQYFLREALNTWHARQALVLQGLQEPLPTEEAYQPDPELYAKHMPAEAPALKDLYGYHPYYQPNELHQAWLDSIVDTLDALAPAHGYADAAGLAAAIAGPGTDAADLIAYTELTNRAYFYFTELSYHIDPTEEEVTAHYNDSRAFYEAAGMYQNGEKAVTIRHILLIPEGADVAADGTVSADDSAWAACEKQANALVSQWKSAVQKTRYSSYSPAGPEEARFAEIAKDHSADPGSSINGGLYANLHRGQLTEALDIWCFDESRQKGDMDILRSDCGIHIVFFSGSTEIWYSAAESDLLQTQYGQLFRTAMDNYPAKIDYASILLGQAPETAPSVTLSDLLYSDVAHERFPRVPLYIQQDYPDTRYGYYPLSSHGCGASVLAMTASYMTDEQITPAQIADTYGYYCGKHGSDAILLDDTPAELGFFLVKRSHNWEEIDRALENGQLVGCLQIAGYWTRSGHYILIIGKTDDGDYIVRDSHLPNYSRIERHAIDSHTRGSLSAASQFYWIYEKKVTRVPACVRCGEDGAPASPGVLFREDYHCPKCLAAINRRTGFLLSIAG